MQNIPLKILFLADSTYNADVVRDHIQAFFCHSRFTLTLLNSCRERAFHDPLSNFDVVVIHYSIFILSDWHLPPAMAQEIREFTGLKAQIIQDEYRQVNAMAERMAWLGIQVIFTVLQPDAVASGYPQACLADVIKHSVNVTGFPPRQLLDYPRRALTARPNDIVYRGRDLPFALGRLGQEKKQIAVGTLQRAASHNLTVDIAWSEEARIYGNGWYDFIASGRATLATESGSSVWDFTGAIDRDIKAYCAEHPTADFEEIYARFLADQDGKITYRAPSPRLFEALCLGTALVLFPSHYSGIFIPDRHYIPLQPDFSNFNDVVAQLRDIPHLERMIARGLDEIIANDKYGEAAYVAEFDTVIATAYQSRIKEVPVSLRPFGLAIKIAAPQQSKHNSTALGSAAYLRLRKYTYRVQNTARKIHRILARQGRLGIFYAKQVSDYINNVRTNVDLTPYEKIRHVTRRVRLALHHSGNKARRGVQQIYSAHITPFLQQRFPPMNDTVIVPKYRCRHSRIQCLKLCARCNGDKPKTPV